ncbi:MAG: glycosyltransferase family 8 protein [Clostridia bacterium]|nr:glycosyltransferase family 8 protein [Clostridia bacterium]
MKKENFNILVTLDRNYILPLQTMIVSILTSNKDAQISLYVAHSSLTDEDFDRIALADINGNLEIFPISVDPSLLCDAPILKRLSKESYYRLIAHEYLPESVDRILYLDPDIAVINSLSPLYNTDLKGNYIAAAGHFDGFLNWYNKIRLGVKHNKDYINSGVLLIDVSSLRKLRNTHKIFDYVEKHASKLWLGDQDTVNAFYDGKILILDTDKYNLDEKTFKKHSKRKDINAQWVRQNTVIVHYDGKNKPWNEPYEGELGEYFFAARQLLDSCTKK